MVMRIGLAGPVRVADLHAWLDIERRSDLPPGMGATPVTLLARGLLERGYEVTVVTLDPRARDEVIVQGERLRICLNPYRMRHRGRDGYQAERLHLERSLRREQPDIVHAHWSYEYSLAALASDLPTLVTVHDWAPTILRMMPDPYRAARLLMNVRVLASARHITTVSPYIAAKLRRWRLRDVTVVPNGLEDDAFGLPMRTPDAAAPVLIAVNDGFTRWKNVSRLLEAHRLLRASIPAARLVLVGGMYEEGGEAHRWARERRLDVGVTFQGQVPYAQVGRLLAGAHVFVHPSLEESFGMAVLEAMAQGLPVVAGARSGAVPWLLDGGRAGVLVDVTSPFSIAKGVAEVLGDPQRWQALSQAGYDRAWNSFRMRQNVEDYLACYERLRTRLTGVSSGRAGGARE